MKNRMLSATRGLFLCIILMVFSAGTLIGCSNSRVEFKVALQYSGSPGGVGISEGRKLIIACMYDWNDFTSPSVSASLTEKFENLNQRYDEQFFIDNALVVFTLGFAAGAINFKEIRLNRSGDELKLEVIVGVGFADAPSFGIVILEISNENISENTTLNAIIIREGLNVY